MAHYIFLFLNMWKPLSTPMVIHLIDEYASLSLNELTHSSPHPRPTHPTPPHPPLLGA